MIQKFAQYEPFWNSANGHSYGKPVIYTCCAPFVSWIYNDQESIWEPLVSLMLKENVYYFYKHISNGGHTHSDDLINRGTSNCKLAIQKQF